MKAYLRISGAVLMGAILIVGALLLPKETRVDAENGIIVTKAPERSAIDIDDSDGDGTPDWEELLAARIVDAIEVPPKEVTPALPYQAPTTFTGRFTESFVADYLKNRGEDETVGDPETFVQNAIASIEAGARSHVYTKEDAITVPDSPEAIRDYGNAIATIMSSKASNGELEIAIVSDALKLNDPSQLERLAPAKQNYKSMVMETLGVSVPKSYLALHLDLINGYEAAYTDIVAMEQAFSDPLYTLSRFKGHYDDLTNIFVAIKGIQDKLTRDGIVYAPEEPGSYLFVFKL